MVLAGFEPSPSVLIICTVGGHLILSATLSMRLDLLINIYSLKASENNNKKKNRGYFTSNQTLSVNKHEKIDEMLLYAIMGVGSLWVWLAGGVIALSMLEGQMLPSVPQKFSYVS